MDFETFKKAVDSMAGFAGIVGIMGGEPTLHPHFTGMLDYYATNREDSSGAIFGDPCLASKSTAHRKIFART